jgi:hypothetical protein
MRWTRCPVRAGSQERGLTHGKGITSSEQHCPVGSMSEELEDIIVTRVLWISGASESAHRSY